MPGMVCEINAGTHACCHAVWTGHDAGALKGRKNLAAQISSLPTKPRKRLHRGCLAEAIDKGWSSPTCFCGPTTDTSSQDSYIVALLSAVHDIHLRHVSKHPFFAICHASHRILSCEQSYLEPRVPDGKPYYTLTAHLSAVQLVYLGSFVTELMVYLTGRKGVWIPRCGVQGLFWCCRNTGGQRFFVVPVCLMHDRSRGSMSSTGLDDCVGCVV